MRNIPQVVHRHAEGEFSIPFRIRPACKVEWNEGKEKPKEWGDIKSCEVKTLKSTQHLSVKYFISSWYHVAGNKSEAKCISLSTGMKPDKILCLLIYVIVKTGNLLDLFSFPATTSSAWLIKNNQKAGRRIRATSCVHLATSHFASVLGDLVGWINLSVREEPGSAARDQGSSPSL